jgi:hypothetical protein
VRPCRTGVDLQVESVEDGSAVMARAFVGDAGEQVEVDWSVPRPSERRGQLEGAQRTLDGGPSARCQDTFLLLSLVHRHAGGGGNQLAGDRRPAAPVLDCHLARRADQGQLRWDRDPGGYYLLGQRMQQDPALRQIAEPGELGFAFPRLADVGNDVCGRPSISSR